MSGANGWWMDGEMERVSLGNGDYSKADERSERVDKSADEEIEERGRTKGRCRLKCHTV